MNSKQQRAKPRPSAKASRAAPAGRPAAEVEKIASLDRPRRTSTPPVVAEQAEQPVPAEQPVDVELAVPAEQPVDVEPIVETEAEAAATAGDDADLAARPLNVADTLARVDSYWHSFQALALRFPRTRIDEPLGRSWTRKQMLAHVAAWHDRTTDRLLAFVKSGAIQPLTDEIDIFNARVARAAIGRTSGEVMGALEASFNRLRRQIGQLTDEQLRAHDGWAAAIIAGNTYDHYDEHAADLQPAGLSSAS